MHHQQHKFIYFMQNELNEIYLVHAIRSFALSMISIFIPIFLLKQGYALTSVAVFYLVQNAIVFLCIKHIIAFTAKRGVKRSIVISMPLTILFFLALYNLPQIIAITGKTPALLIVSIMNIAASSYYYMGFHIDFAKMHERKKAAKQVSILNIATVAVAIIAPLLGASIIVWSSFNTLFLINIALIIGSSIPLAFSKDIHEEKTVDFKGIYTKKEWWRFAPYIGEGFRGYAASIFWPILLFLIAINLQEMGGIFTSSNVLLAALTLYLGKRLHEGNQQKVLRVGSWVHSLTLVIRTLVKTVATIAVVQGLAAITYGFVSLPYSTIHYNRSQKEGAARITYAREIYLMIGRSLAIFLLLFLLWVGIESKPALIALIILGGFAAVLMGELQDRSTLIAVADKKQQAD